jgi:tyrosine-protein phosphatase SIW14
MRSARSVSSSTASSEASDPEEKEVVQFLKLVGDPGNQPVFVHCAYGSDRTGLMIAMYRIVLQGWRNDDAYEEMVNGGYGFHTIYKDIQTYVRAVDAKALRQKAGAPSM